MTTVSDHITQALEEKEAKSERYSAALRLHAMAEQVEDIRLEYFEILAEQGLDNYQNGTLFCEKNSVFEKCRNVLEALANRLERPNE